jgi:CheY-like chemotaxis protein
MMKGILHSLAYRSIDFAHHGEVALQRCQEPRYHIVFIDYNQETGKNDRQQLEDLRQVGLQDAESICMLVNGKNTVSMVIRELEPDDYLLKPFSQSVLRTRLQRIQQKKQCLYAVYLAMFCNQVAEFELAEQFEPVARLDADHIALSLWRQQHQQVEPQRLAFSQFSRQGLSCYEQGDYAGAAKHYEQALLCVPHNSSTQLNLLQAVLQCISRDMPIVNVAPADTIRRIQLQPLVGAQQERLQMLQRKFADLIASSK